MNKQPDFGHDLSALNENVNAEVGDVLQALKQKRNAHRPTIIRQAETPASQPSEPNTEERIPPTPPTAVKLQRSPRDAPRSRTTPVLERDEVWKSVTTRLRLETVELLKESCLRQELKKKSPHTGQGIVDEALGDWFRKHGYSRSRVDESVD